MTKEELAEKISKLKGIEPVPELPMTFMERVPLSETVHFLLPVADDVVLKTSSLKGPYEQAVNHAGP